MTRLYIVEGLPCSGKSTASKYIADRLAAKGRDVAFFDEGSGDHPADYEFHAYVSQENLPRLAEPLREKVKRYSEWNGGGYIVPLSRFSGEEFDRLLPYKIYDFLPWETEMPLMLERWQNFVKSAELGSVHVFNCVLFQNPMCETMMRFGFSQEQSFEYISKIAEIISPLEPAVVYLKTDDSAESIRAAAPQRDGWLDTVVDYHVNGRYGKSINAQGFSGYLACLEERQCRELSILGQLPIKSIVIDNPQRDWGAAYKQINSFLETAG